MVGDDLRDHEKEVPLFRVIEAMCSPETVFLGDSCDAEGLTGKAAAEDVVRGYVGNGDSMYVTVGFLAVVRLVGLLAEFVVIRGKNALCALLFKGDAEAAYAAKKIDEAELFFAVFLWVFTECGCIGSLNGGFLRRRLAGGGMCIFLSGHQGDFY